MQDLAKRPYGSDRLAEIFRALADGKLAPQIAADLGMTAGEVADGRVVSSRLLHRALESPELQFRCRVLQPSRQPQLGVTGSVEGSDSH